MESPSQPMGRLSGSWNELVHLLVPRGLGRRLAVWRGKRCWDLDCDNQVRQKAPVNPLLTAQCATVLVAAFMSGCAGGACGGTVSSSSGSVPESGTDATFDSGSDVVSDAGSEDSGESSAETCVVTACDGRKVEIPYHNPPYDGGVYVGYDGGGAWYCPAYCGTTDPVCQAPSGCFCQCVKEAADPSSPKVLFAHCSDCVCGDSGTWMMGTAAVSLYPCDGGS
jgi:hypothetical protein